MEATANLPYDPERIRLEKELEFVQCLGNPDYLLFLAQRGFFKDDCFVNYLNYLQYWSRPEYSRFIRYPICLKFLELLQIERFRLALVNTPTVKFIEDQIILHWHHFHRRRAYLASNEATNNKTAAAKETSDKRRISSNEE